MAEGDIASATQDPAGEIGAGAIDRRTFLNGIAATALGIAAAGAGAVTIRYLSPNVLFEPPTNFSIGPPDSYPMDSVTYLAEQEVYVVRTAGGMMAESAICTHLGCITQWKPELGMIACPCHGSRFNKDGTVAHGPAPSPLQHFALRVLPDGNLQVDKLEIVSESQILKV